MTSNYIFNTKHYIGIGCMIVAVILYFTNRKIYYFFFALTLTLGLIGFLNFYVTSYKVGFADIGVNPIFLGLIILFFVVSRNRTDKLSPDKSTNMTKDLDENLVESFESKFRVKSVEELNAIANDDSKFTDEAKAAAKRILEAKNAL